MTAAPRTVRRAKGAPPAPPPGGASSGPARSSSKGLAWFKTHKPEALLGLAGIGVAIYLYEKQKSSSSSSTSTQGDGTLLPGTGGGDWGYLGGGPPGGSTPLQPANPTKGPGTRRGRPGPREKPLPVDPLTAAGRRRNTVLEANARRRNDRLNANAQRRRDQLEANARRREERRNAGRPANRRSSNPQDALGTQFESQFGGRFGGQGPVHLGRT